MKLKIGPLKCRESQMIFALQLAEEMLLDETVTANSRKITPFGVLDGHWTAKGNIKIIEQ